MKPVLVLRHVPHESLGLIAAVFDECDLPYRYVNLYATAPPEIREDDWSALVVMGGPMNVDETDRYPFLAAEVRWLRGAVAADRPVLGVCLGSQLLAKALGARVYPNPVKEIGWYEIELTPAAAADPLFCDCAPAEMVFQWHGDTFDLPAGAVPLARSRDCANQAFRYGRTAYGLQFHLETTPDLIDRWLADPATCAELERSGITSTATLRRQTAVAAPRMQMLGERVFRRFAELCGR
jgi:GMP synthase (glutamine-hydrolysing)